MRVSLQGKTGFMFLQGKIGARFVLLKRGCVLCTILIDMHVGSLGTRLSRVGIALDDFYFVDQE